MDTETVERVTGRKMERSGKEQREDKERRRRRRNRDSRKSARERKGELWGFLE